MRNTLISSWPLFFGIAMIMIGNGLQGTLLGLRATMEGFGTVTTGAIMSFYYVGFLAGSVLTPKMLENVGHIRVFAALASLISATILLHMVFIDPFLWLIIRLVTGFGYAGLYVVVESWLNGVANNKNRGKVLSLYMLVVYIGLLLGQGLLNIADPMKIELFVLASVLISLALIPISLSKRPAPHFEAPERMSIKKLYKTSPLGVMGVLMAGLIGGTFFAIGPVYAVNTGMSVAQISVFMMSLLFGALIFQYPVAWLADRYDRRIVIMGSAFGAAVLGIMCYLSPLDKPLLIYLSVFLFWGAGHSLYSLSLAYVNDRLERKHILTASGTLVLLNGVGAVSGPLLATIAMAVMGNDIFFPLLSSFFLGVFFLALYRKSVSEAVPAEDKSSYVSMPPRPSPVVAQIAENIMISGGAGVNDNRGKS